MAEWNGQKPITRLLGITQIVADHEFQSRAAMSVADMKEFSEAMIRAETYEFPAVVVFEVKPGCFMLADGFHRHGAAKAAMAINSNFRNIKADIYQGTIEDVLIYSAGANQKFSIKRTSEDMKKAVWMLLGIESWRTKSTAWVARHVGNNRTSVDRWRVEYLNFHKIPEPVTLETESGNTVSSRRRTKPGGLSPLSPQKWGFNGSVGGRTMYLGKTEEEAKLKQEVIADKIQKKRSKLSAQGKIQGWLARRGFAFDSALVSGKRAAFPGLSGLVGQGCVVAVEPMDFAEQAVMAVGRAVLLNQYHGGENRMVVLSYLEFTPFSPEKVVELAKLAGVEFMTPEEFVVSLGGKAEADEAGEPEAEDAA